MSEEQFWATISLRKKESLVKASVGAFREQGIETVLIKGWAIGQFYPSEQPRSYADIDIAVNECEFSEARRLLLESNDPRFNVDLHNELRHLDTLPWDVFFARTEIIDLDGVPIRVPCPEDHLRILAVHWLTDGGEYKERLWDIYYAVANRPETFDWDKCLNCVSPTRRKWVITTIGLAHKYLDLPIDDLPFAEEAKEIPSWITRCLEREWARETRLIPLRIAWRRPKMLLQQIKKRIPPNPIQSTIDMEGEFDERSRLRYQIGSILKRIGPSIRRTSASVFYTIKPPRKK